MKLVYLILLILLIWILFEHFRYYFVEGYLDPLYTNHPFWNIQLGNKRNMSYDIRGDPYIPRTYTGPWNQSTLTPIRNPPIWAV